MTLQEINRSIIAGTFSSEDLNSIGDAIKFARGQLATKNKGTLVKGTKVKFTNSRSGMTVIGQVEKVNRKFVIVRENKPGSFIATNWRVPASMLSAV
jgi:hypothetical protein